MGPICGSNWLQDSKKIDILNFVHCLRSMVSNLYIFRNSLIRVGVEKVACWKSFLTKDISVSLPFELSPDSWVLSVADGRELLGKERVHLGVDGNQLAQCLSGSQPHCTARVLQGLQKGRLQLRQEGLQGNSHLEEEHSPEVRASYWDFASVNDDLMIFRSHCFKLLMAK